MKLNNKIAVVTGGASGLGEATVRRYVKNGAKCAIFDLNEKRGNSLVKELGSAVKFYKVNVSSEESVQEAVAQVMEDFGAIHICNNYAGIGSAEKTIGKHGPANLAAFNKVISVNLIGTFNVSRLVAWEMAKNEPVTESGTRGVIINTASVAAFEGQIGQIAYSASKGGIISMTLVMARDLARSGIRVNTIVPGLIHTPLFDSLPEEAYDSLVRQPLHPKRLGKPDEIAHLSQYIVENDYTNGECIRMDAGIRMQPR